jgi:hypothetical protein
MDPKDPQFDKPKSHFEEVFGMLYGEDTLARMKKSEAEKKAAEPDEQDDDRDPKNDHWDA